MNKLLIIIFLLSARIFAFSDSDLDGVDDKIDRCPNSKITDIVDKFGCKTVELKIKHKRTSKILKKDKTKFKITHKLSHNTSIKIDNKEKIDEMASKAYIDIYLGYSQSHYKNIKTRSFDTSLSILYKNYQLYLSSSKYSSTRDYLISFYYKKAINDNLYCNVAVGLYSSNDKFVNSYYFSSIELSYLIKKWDLSIKYKRLFNKHIKDTNFYEFSVGYNFDKLYLYSTINYETSPYKYLGATKLISLGAKYYFDNNFYISAQYSKGLGNQPIHALSLGVGYSF